MNRHLWKLVAVFAMLGLSRSPALAQQPAPAEDGIAVQARGPVHEAYAQPYTPDPQAAPVVPRQPPPPIPEEPPDQKPQGENVQWIPGYWAWDQDRSDFIWVSGFWRVPPPDRRWVPGYWAQADGGWRWVPGLWANAAEPEVQYVDTPPATLDSGPGVPAPDDNSFYVPGCWVPRDDQFAWRPGFWQSYRPDYVWTNAQYCWTPRGYAFTDGYWDYGLEDRGLLFAPVAFTQPLWTTPGWFYRPGFAVGFDGLLGSLFARPRDHHYYFGDYYGANYLRAGYQPWFGYGPRVHDGLWDHYRWQHRGERGWAANVEGLYRSRLNGELPRPARTFAEQTAVLHNSRGRDVNSLRLVTPLNQFGGRTRLTTVTDRQRTQSRVAVQQFRDVSRQRSQVERVTAGAGRNRGASAVHSRAAQTVQQTNRRVVQTDHRVNVRQFHDGNRPVPQPRSRFAEQAGRTVSQTQIRHQVDRASVSAVPHVTARAPNHPAAPPRHAAGSASPSFAHAAPARQPSRPAAPPRRTANAPASALTHAAPAQHFNRPAAPPRHAAGTPPQFAHRAAAPARQPSRPAAAPHFQTTAHHAAPPAPRFSPAPQRHAAPPAPQRRSAGRAPAPAFHGRAPAAPRSHGRAPGSHHSTH